LYGKRDTVEHENNSAYHEWEEVKISVKDGIVYDAKNYLEDVSNCDKAKQMGIASLKQPGLDWN